MGLSSVAATVLAGLVVAAFSPYLARLTVSVPDRSDTVWWRARASCSISRLAVVAAAGLGCGALAGASSGRVAWEPFVWCGFVWLGLVVTPVVVIDIEHHRLPDRLVIAGLLGGTVFLGSAALVDGAGPNLLRALTAVVVVFVLSLVLTLAGGFGFGDAKLLAVLAGYLGWLGWGYVLCGIAGGFCVGALASIPLLITRRLSLKTAVPFGPALVIGALLVPAFRLVPESLA